MIFKSKFYLQDRLGEERVVRKFVLWPRHFGTDKRGKWMTFADIVEKVCEVDVGGSMEWGDYRYKWVEVAFADRIKARPTIPRGCFMHGEGI